MHFEITFAIRRNKNEGLKSICRVEKITESSIKSVQGDGGEVRRPVVDLMNSQCNWGRRKQHTHSWQPNSAHWNSRKQAMSNVHLSSLPPPKSTNPTRIELTFLTAIYLQSWLENWAKQQ